MPTRLALNCRGGSADQENGRHAAREAERRGRHLSVRPCYAAAGSFLAFMILQKTLADADGFQGNFHQLVVSDELDGRFQGELNWGVRVTASSVPDARIFVNVSLLWD